MKIESSTSVVNTILYMTDADAIVFSITFR
jgi:hypothetical protein